MAGQTNDSLALPFVNASAAGIYAVEVRTACEVVTNNATLTVLPAPGASPARYTNSEPILITEFGPSVTYGSVVLPQCVLGVVKNVTVSIWDFFIISLPM